MHSTGDRRQDSAGHRAGPPASGHSTRRARAALRSESTQEETNCGEGGMSEARPGLNHPLRWPHWHLPGQPVARRPRRAPPGLRPPPRALAGPGTASCRKPTTGAQSAAAGQPVDRERQPTDPANAGSPRAHRPNTHLDQKQEEQRGGQAAGHGAQLCHLLEAGKAARAAAQEAGPLAVSGAQLGQAHQRCSRRQRHQQPSRPGPRPRGARTPLPAPGAHLSRGEVYTANSSRLTCGDGAGEGSGQGRGHPGAGPGRGLPR